MKKIICIILMIFLTGCKSFYIDQALKPKDRQFTQRLPHMELVFENENFVKHWNPGEKVVRENSPSATLFYREMEKNITNPYGEARGYIVLRPILINQEYTGAAWSVFSSVLYGIPLLLGLPFGASSTYTELEIDVLNKKAELIKRYNTSAKAEEYIAAYWGYNIKNSLEASRFNSYSKALEQAINQIYEDRQLIAQKIAYQ